MCEKYTHGASSMIRLASRVGNAPSTELLLLQCVGEAPTVLDLSSLQIWIVP
jgi:hypothetical protein